MTDDHETNETDARVIRLGASRGGQDDAALAEFVRYWKKTRRADGIPTRSDIDPRGISALISNAFVVERIAPGLARMRIAGTHLSDLMGMEVRGMPLSALFQPDPRDALAHDLVRLFDEPAMLRMSLTAGPAHGPGLEGALVMLPLRSDLGDISRAIGCLVTRGPVTQAPYRFAMTSRSVTPVTITQDIRNVGADLAQATPLAGFAEDQAEFGDSGPRRNSAERPYLKLVR